MGTYTKTVKATVTNSLDTAATIDIPVKKEWIHNGNENFHARYAAVIFILQIVHADVVGPPPLL